MLARDLPQAVVRRAPGDVPLTQRARHRGDADTPDPAAPPVPPERRGAVASVTAVTEAAHVATRTTPPPAALPAAPVPVPAGPTGPPPPVVRPLPADERRGGRSPGTPALPPAPPPASVPAAAPAAVGKREVKRQETRARIVDAAADLFAERGFDAVSVVEIARRAGVVEKTVFNHFPVKEGLVFDADPPMRTALLETVRRRPTGESVSAAAGTFVVAAVAMLGSEEAADGVARMARIVRGSRTLQVREREILDELTRSLAELIAEENDQRSGQLEPWLAASAVLGLYAGLLELARDRVLAGVTGPALAAELRRRGTRGLSLLQFGLAGYAKRR